MTEGRRRGNKPPPRVTQQRLPAAVERVTTPMGAVRAQRIEGAVQRLEVDENRRTAVMESKQWQEAPADEGALPSVIIAPQQPLPEEASLEVRVGGGPEPVTPIQVWVATDKLPEDPDPRLILLTDPDSERAASFRVLRHRLQEHGDPRVIAVTSARSEEGKTTCAVNLALALGECGRARVLLVEANLRAPTLASLFGIVLPECFAAQMKRHKDLPLDAWSVVELFSPSLHVLAVKPEGEGGRPLLDGPGLSLAIAVLRQAGYDYIVLDTPPVLGAADVNLIEDAVDGVLFVALAQSTPARSLRRAIEQLAPGKLLGITLLDA